MTVSHFDRFSLRYVCDSGSGVWKTKNGQAFGYSDGDDAENSIYQKLKATKDVSCASDELTSKINDWPSEYHLSPARHNLLIPLCIKKEDHVLELGCGMGAITRYLGETGAQVTAVEGSYRRACLTRERCRDLHNVTVVCDNFRHFASDELFDIVTLIGVLEYAPQYIGGEDPIAECIRIAASRLKPGGSLIIAIENRLGLKYWNNCAEDHTGRMFDSIHDTYLPGTVCTFGQVELRRLLSRAGFVSVQFGYLFPDYKLTNIVLNEGSFQHSDVSIASMLGHASSRDYTGQPYRYFSERLAWHTLEKNDLIPHFANSFLVVASMSKQVCLFDCGGWIAKIYSSSRNAAYRTETAIVRDCDSGRLFVNKERLYKALPLAEGPLQFDDNANKDYISGTLLSDELLKVLLQRNPYEAFAQKLLEYKEFVAELNNIRNPEGRPDYCSGDLIDCAPFNIVRGRDNRLYLIDDEWRLHYDIPFVVVLLRGIFIELVAKINYSNNPALFAEHADLKDLITDLFSKIGLRLTQDDIDTFCRIEASIQAQVAKSGKDLENLYRVHRELFSMPLANALHSGTRLSLWEACRQQQRKTSGSQAEAERSVAEPLAAARAASIVILTYNSSKTITRCLDSVIRTLRPEDEVIVVDNASVDATIQMIEKCIGSNEQITLIKNSKNTGFSAGCNVGITLCHNPYIVLLNPDTIVSSNWLPRLLAHFDDLTVGAVGPVSDYVAGLQKMGLYQKESITHGSGIDAIALQFIRWNRGRSVETKLLIGFCMAVRRELIEALGPLDEDLFLGNDDLELSWRLRANGHRLLVATDTFIHHEGQQSFITIHKETTARLVQESTDALYAKLEACYGANRVPLPQELWGIEWFTPQKAQFCKSAKFMDLLRLPRLRGQVIHERLTSIVILTFNQLSYTKECIESIQQSTTEAHEVIFVDNGSTDGTVKWLRDLVSGNDAYRLIENRKNLGFAKGCNQGIEAAKGEFILLLNNDVVVTKDWLGGMLECLEREPDTGIVGPMTNSISGPQRVDSADYGSSDNLDEYAARFRERNRHRTIPMRRIVGFCMLFRRSLSGQIGLLDESFGTGNFEDDDLCLRAELAGYINRIAGDVFIHHYGSRSFIGNRIDYKASLLGNRELFDRKWGAVDLKTSEGKGLFCLQILDKADELRQRGDIAGAVTVYSAGIKQCPDQMKLYYAVAGMLLDAGQFQYALDMIQLAPDCDADPRCLALSGYCHDGLDDQAKARQYAEKALSRNPNLASAVNLMGIVSHKAGERNAAESYFNNAAELDKGYGEPYANRGVIAWSDGQKEAAVDLLERGFLLSPLASNLAMLYHAALQETGSLERGRRVFQDVSALYPFHRQILFLLIDVVLKLGNDREAMHRIEKAMATYGIDEGILAAALDVRGRIGLKTIAKGFRKQGTLSVCMIVKNEEKNLARCLLSVGPVADEIIIVDTGSKDKTREIARAFGAKVLDFQWNSNFSDARNASLQEAQGDWILVLDADEVISPLDHDALRKIASRKPKRPAAYSIVTRNYTDLATIVGWTANDNIYPEQAAGGWVASKKVRLFCRDSRIRFEQPVHELVEESLRRASIRIEPCAIPVHHYGKLDRNTLQDKGNDYILMGQAKLKEVGNDVQALTELGRQFCELGRYDEAVAYWLKLSELTPDNADVYVNLSGIYLSMENYNDARRTAKQALAMNSLLKEALLNYAVSELFIGEAQTVIVAIEQFCEKRSPYPPLNALLGVAYIVQGDKEKGISLLSRLEQEGYRCLDYITLCAKQLIVLQRRKDALAIIIAALDLNLADKELLSLLMEALSPVD